LELELSQETLSSGTGGTGCGLGRTRRRAARDA
jgi:hypothetical protein